MNGRRAFLGTVASGLLAPRVFAQNAPSYGDAFLPPAETAARALGLVTRVIRVADTGANLEEKLREAAAQPATTDLLLGSPIFFRERARVAAQALALRLPVVGTSIESVEAGQLLYFGPSLVEIYRRCAEYVDKVLRGADPANLPIEQPTKFELAFNLRTAKALDVIIPRAMLLRAETVIQQHKRAT